MSICAVVGISIGVGIAALTYSSFTMNGSSGFFVAKPEQQSRPKKKTICFHRKTKKHDGLKRESSLIQKYIFGILRNDHTFVSSLAKKHDVESIVIIRKMLENLISRCEKNQNDYVFVLPHGGGNLSICQKKHIPYLKRNVVHLTDIIEKVREIIIQKKKRKKRIYNTNRTIRINRININIHS